MTFGIDYAWGRPSVQALQNAGVKFALRYLSTDAGKNLSPDEAKTLSDAGIWVGVVWETTAERALGGYGAGRSDALEAARQAADCGMPADRPIYFGVDFDATAGQMNTVMEYLDGAATSLRGVHRTGVYGSYAVVTAALDGKHAAFGWQTYAWSGGQWDPRAQLQQYSNDHTIDGVGVDFNRATTDDFGQWRVGVSPSPGQTPTPQEDDMLIGQVSTGKGVVTPISWPAGKAKAIGFFADTGLAPAGPDGKQPVVKLRVSWHRGGKDYAVKHIVLDSTQGKTVVSFGADAPHVDAVAVKREGGDQTDDIPVAWDAS